MSERERIKDEYVGELLARIRALEDAMTATRTQVIAIAAAMARESWDEHPEDHAEQLRRWALALRDALVARALLEPKP